MRALLIVSLAACSDTTTHALFDGRSLAGWQGDPALWRVDDGAIVGVTDGTLDHNTFLVHAEPVANFVLRAEFQLRSGNSGLQFRSVALPDHVVHGYQADIATDTMGILYDEGGRGTLADTDQAAVLSHVDLAGWNRYEVSADGPHITLSINGYTTVEYVETEDAPDTGVIALQLHVGPPMEVRFRELVVDVR